MSLPERPRLRPYLQVSDDGPDPGQLVLLDRLRLSRAAFHVSPLQLRLLALFDGTRTLPDIQADATRLITGGALLDLSFLAHLAGQLDEALFLDTPRFRRLAEGDIRPPACIGAYPEDPDDVRRLIHALFTGPGGAGLPGPAEDGPPVRAILVPHIDYARGGACYTHAYRRLAERCAARLFVVVGTSHYSLQRFTLTRKHFRTPLGVVPTDRRAVDLLAAHGPAGLFDDEWLAHFPEHSIELELIFLQYLLSAKRDFRIVPLLVGSFQDCVRTGQGPGRRGDIAQMVGALRTLERELGEAICYVISGDLAHIGPKFGDARAVDERRLAQSDEQDRRCLEELQQGSPDGLFGVIAEEGDRRRICGLPPAWTALTALGPARGRVLAHDRYVHPRGQECVSFASMIFEGEG